MQFDYKTKYDDKGQWALYHNGGAFFKVDSGNHPFNTLIIPEEGVKVLKSLIEAWEQERDRQIEAKPKPGEFEVGDTVEGVASGNRWLVAAGPGGTPLYLVRDTTVNKLLDRTLYRKVQD